MNQGDFRPGQGSVDHIFNQRQMLQHKHMYRWLTIFVFLDLISVDRAILWRCLSPKSVTEIHFTLYTNNRGRVYAYGDVSAEFHGGIARQGFHFNFVFVVVFQIALSPYEKSCTVAAGVSCAPTGQSELLM